MVLRSCAIEKYKSVREISLVLDRSEEIYKKF